MTYFQKKLTLSGLKLEEFQNLPICFKANFKDEVNGISGSTKLTYEGFFNSLMKLETSFTEFPNGNLVYSDDGNKSCPADDLVAVAINAYWPYESVSDILNKQFPQNYVFGYEGCSAITGGIYDPQYSCAIKSDNSPACEAMGRGLLPFCEVGNLRCIHGAIKPALLGLWGGGYDNLDTPAASLWDYMFRTSQQNWGSVTMSCGRGEDVMFCAKLDLVDCITEEVVDLAFYAKGEFEQIVDHKKGLVEYLISTVLKSDHLLTKLTNLI